MCITYIHAANIYNIQLTDTYSMPPEGIIQRKWEVNPECHILKPPKTQHI